MPFDIAIAFDVNTEQLVNARNALQSLGQAASDLNVKQDKATKTSSALVQSTEELTAANTKAAAAANAAAEAITRVGEAAPKASKGAETAEAKLEKLQSQLSFMRDDLDLTSTGFTRSQAGVLAWAKSVGASIDMLQKYTKVFDDMNKIVGVNPFDQSAKGLAMLNNEMLELERSKKLVKDGITLTSQQTKMLTRDLEALKQQNEALGKAASDGASEYERAFIEKAKAVNNLRAVAAEAEREEKERAKQAAAIAKEEERFYAAAAREYEEQERRKTEALQREEAKRLAIIENARKSVNDKLMNEWAGGVGVKSPELSKMASGYEQEMKAQAAAAKVAADAINYLEQEQRKLAVTTELMARGFTASSASALYKYKEALEATGASAMDVKQKLYLFEQDLIKRQDKSPFAQMRKDIKQVQEDTNHLARAISVQLGDVAVSLAGGMNPFLVLIQQGDQIRFAVQQAKDAGQDLSKVMQGAFASMFESFKLVGSVVKEFAVDGMRTLANSFTAPIKHMTELHRINNQLSSGLIDSAKAAELKARSSEILAGSMRTLNLVIHGGVLAAIALLAAAYVSLSREQDKVAKMNAQFGASFGATTQEALAMARGLNEVGVSTAQAVEAMSGLMKAGEIGKESFQGIAVAASEANKWVGVSIEETIKKFNELADDPMKVLSEFTIQTGYLSQAQLQLVRDHLEAGDSAKAQAEAIKLLEDGYRQMASQAKQDMSDLGVAMVELKGTTTTLWDTFKNSSGAVSGINAIKFALRGVAQVLYTLPVLGKELGNLGGFISDVKLTDNPDEVKKKWAFYQGEREALALQTKKFLDDLWKDETTPPSPSGIDVGKNSSDARVVKSIEAFTRATEDSTAALAKKLSMGEYVAKRLKEENDKATKGLSDSEKEAYLASTEYGKQATDASKKFTKEWEDANKKSSKSVASTYKVARDNELTETKKFYDSQLKGLQDIENKKSQINKSEYESRIISFGEYLAREMQLVEESKNAQTAIINKAEAEYTAAISREKEEHQAAAASAIAAGGSAKAINEQLAQSIQNIENRTKSYSEAVKQQREALERATEAKYAKFYEEIAKQINASKDALEKFNETVEENARKRSEDLKNQRALMGLYGSEAAAYKASTSTMAGYRSEIDRVKKALDKATKSRIDLQKAIAADPNATDTQRKALEEMLRLEEQLRGEHNEKLKNAQIDSNQAAMDAIEAYNLEVFKEIRDALSEDIYNALFEGGKSGGDALKSVLKKMFKNYVINVILNPIMGNIVGSVMGATGVASGAQQFGGGGSLDFMNLSGSLGGTIASIGSKFGIQAAESFGMGLQGITLDNAIAGTYGGTAYNLGSTIGGWDASISKVPGFEGGFGSVLGYGKAVFDLTEGNYGSSIGTAIGTYILPGIGTAIGSTIGSLVDGMFGGSPYYGGDAVSVGGKQSWTGKQGGGYDSGVGNFFGSYAQGMSAVLTDLLKEDILVKIGFDENEKRARAYLDIYDTSGNIGVSRSGVSVAKGEEGAKEAINLVAKEAFTQLLASEELTSFEKKLVEAANAAGGTYENLISVYSQIKEINAVFSQLGQTMSMFSGISDDMKTALLGAFGSIQGVAEVAGNYYQNFYSEEERFRKAGEAVNAALRSIGVELDVFGGEAAKIQYRELVEKAFAEGNQELAAQLLQMSAAFSEVANAAEQATRALNESLVAILKRFSDGAIESKDLQAQILAEDASKIWKSIPVDSLKETILTATSSDIEKYLREAWAYMDTTEAKQSLISLGNALLDFTTASKEAERATAEKEYSKRVSATDEALRVLERSINLQKKQLNEQLKAAQETANLFKRLSDTLSDAIKKLRGQVEQTYKMQVAEAMRVIDVAKITGVMPDPERLTEAVGVLVGSVEQGLYATQYDKSKAFLTLANDFEYLKDKVDPQLSAAEATVKRIETQIEQLDLVLENARKQIEELRKANEGLLGIDSNITNVDAAVKQLETAIQAEAHTKAIVDAINNIKIVVQAPPAPSFSPGGGIVNVSPSGGGGGFAGGLLDFATNTVVNGLLGGMGVSAATDWSGAISSVVGQGAGPQGDLYASMVNSGMSHSAIVNAVSGAGFTPTPSEWSAIQQAAGIRSRAVGGYTPPGLTLVGEEGPEIVNFKSPSMIYTAAQSANLMGGSNTDLIAEIKALRSEVVMLRAEARATAFNTARTYRVLDDVTQGGDTLKTTSV